MARKWRWREGTLSDDEAAKESAEVGKFPTEDSVVEHLVRSWGGSADTFMKDGILSNTLLLYVLAGLDNKVRHPGLFTLSDEKQRIKITRARYILSSNNLLI